MVTIMAALSWFTPYPMAKHFHLTIKDPSVISPQNTHDIVADANLRAWCLARGIVIGILNIQLLQMVSSGVCA
jgi:hypothetical protein